MQPEAILDTLDKDDASQIVRIWNEALKEEASGEGWHWRDHWLTERKLDDMLRNPNYDPEGSLVLRAGERVVGYARAVIKRVASYEEDNLPERPAYLEGFVVDRQWRGRGLGRQLLDRLESYALAQGSASSSRPAGIPPSRISISCPVRPDIASSSTGDTRTVRPKCDSD